MSYMSFIFFLHYLEYSQTADSYGETFTTVTKNQKIIADEFVGVVTSMSGCSEIDLNLGHQLFERIFFPLVHESYRELSHSFHILFYPSQTITRLYTKCAVGRER
jgi:hypothetical protein